MVDEVAEVVSNKSMTRAIYKVPFTCVSPFTMACPFLDDVLDEEALILRRAFQRGTVFRDRSDLLVFPDNYLHERYRWHPILMQTAGSQNSAPHSAESRPHHPTDGLCCTTFLREWNVLIFRGRC